MKWKKQLAVGRAHQQAYDLLSINLVMLFMLMEQQAINNIRAKQQAAQREQDKKEFDTNKWLSDNFSIDFDKLDSLSKKQDQIPPIYLTHIDNTP